MYNKITYTKKICSENKCHNIAICKGLCKKHYDSLRRKEGFGKICEKENCNKPIHARDVCLEHYDEFRSKEGMGKICSECDKPARARGLCNKHYQQLIREYKEKNIEFN